MTGAAIEAAGDAMVTAELDKRYGANQVLTGARLTVRRGTVHALVGENGAGKSTLVKIVAGVVHGDGGTLAIAGKRVEVATWDRRAARAAGVGIVQQHGASAGTLSVVENAVLGVEPLRGPLIELGPAAEALRALGQRIGLPGEPWAAAERLPVGVAQRAEIIAALHHGAKPLILDEPTAVLTPIEVDGLLETLRKLAAGGTTIVLVTHKLDEVRAVADEVTVLRAGKTVTTFAANREAAPGDRLDVAAIARAMVGTDLPPPPPAAAPAADARIVLELAGVLVGGELQATDLRVRAGEIVGVAGVDGNGQRELALAIAGLVRVSGGAIRIADRPATQATPAARFALGLAHIPEDRQHGGLWLDATVADNLALGRSDITGRFRIDRARVQAHAGAQITELDIRPGDPAARVRSLSGGNQQKVVIGRELSRRGLSCVLAAQPTRGVDLGAVVRIHDRLRGAAAAGAGVLVISADLDELLALCHRIVVMLRGRIVGEREGAALREAGARSALGALMTGVEAA
ncbi:MAG: ATP-binding cassette domain-containing protein [Deltaproteobacteria bacterium]|nr:MAG: ATP-binding cassette domain-containing protein [Deltaproteobacteria bacterium]